MWVVDHLERGLLDADPIVRARSAEALGHMRHEALGGVPVLALTSVADKDSGVRASATTALTRIGASPDAVLDSAIQLLEHPDESVRARAGWAIGKLDPEVAARAISALIERLALDPSADARFAAAWAFGRMRSTDQGAIDALQRALLDRAGDVRAEAARALGRTGWAAGGALTALVPLLSDVEPLVRAHAATALRGMNGNTPEALAALRTLTMDPVAYVRDVATTTLTSFRESMEPNPAHSPGDAPVEEGPGTLGIVARLTDSVDFVRAEAAWLLAKHGVPATEVTTRLLVLQALVDRDSDARWSALYAIARVGRRSPEVTRAVVRALAHDRDPDVRQAAAAALGALWQEAADDSVAGLITALSDEDALVREDAAESLGAIGVAATPAREALERALADSHGGVRARAAESISIIDSATP